MPRIYVASLSDYNSGRLHGRWIDANQDEDSIWEEVQAMLEESKEPIAEEWAIHDYDGFGDLRLGEYESFERISLIAQDIELYGEGETAAFLGNFGADFDGSFPDYYVGQFESEKDYAYEYVSDCGWANLDSQQLESIEPYLDWDAIARDLFSDGYWSARAGAPDYGVYVFRSEA